MVSAKPRFPRALALDVAREILRALDPACERLLVAGSLRRRKAEVGDVEILYIPRTRRVTTDLFGGCAEESEAEPILAALIAEGILERRTNVIERPCGWGARNQFAVHCASGVPVDFFAATTANWANYCVCRTGGARMNVEIANAARLRGWQWNPYSEGFSRPSGLGREVHRCTTEQEVFAFVGLDWKEPWERP